jgi:F-type H+-transporting ATPase subunit gamma
MQKRAIDMPAEPKELVIPITTDKGLCGGINSGVFRAVRTYVNERDRSKIEIMAIGGKGASAMKRPFADILRLNICEIMVPFNFPMVLAIAQHINEQSAGKDKIVVFYNEFESAISQILRTVELMPKHTFLETVKQGKLYHSMAIPDKNTANPALYELYVTSNLWKCFLNNACSEEGSRMNAMENASKNSREMKDSLTLQYNYARQARITTELCEIISGASAME